MTTFGNGKPWGNRQLRMVHQRIRAHMRNGRVQNAMDEFSKAPAQYRGVVALLTFWRQTGPVVPPKPPREPRKLEWLHPRGCACYGCATKANELRAAFGKTP